MASALEGLINRILLYELGIAGFTHTCNYIELKKCGLLCRIRVRIGSNGEVHFNAYPQLL